MNESKRRDRVDNETSGDQQLRGDYVADLYERGPVGNREKDIQKSEQTEDEHKDTVRFREENAEFTLRIVWRIHPNHRNSAITENFILFILITIQLDSRPTRSLHGETLVATRRPERYIFTMIEREEKNDRREPDSTESGLRTTDAKER